jgi:hypothetical protein
MWGPDLMKSLKTFKLSQRLLPLKKKISYLDMVILPTQVSTQLIVPEKQEGVITGVPQVCRQSRVASTRTQLWLKSVSKPKQSHHQKKGKSRPKAPTKQDLVLQEYESSICITCDMDTFGREYNIYGKVYCINCVMNLCYSCMELNSQCKCCPNCGSPQYCSCGKSCYSSDSYECDGDTYCQCSTCCAKYDWD